MTPTRLANPRRTTLAALQAVTRCELDGPACRGTATRLVTTPEGERHACPTCAAR